MKTPHSASIPPSADRADRAGRPGPTGPSGPTHRATAHPDTHDALLRLVDRLLHHPAASAVLIAGAQRLLAGLRSGRLFSRATPLGRIALAGLAVGATAWIANRIHEQRQAQDTGWDAMTIDHEEPVRESR